MTDFFHLAKEIHVAFPHVPAPESFREECVGVLAQGYNPGERNPSDNIDVLLAYRGMPWWELFEEYRKDYTLADRIESNAPLLNPEVWCYYAPVPLLYYVDVMLQQDAETALAHTEHLNNMFGNPRYLASRVDFFTLGQKQYIGAIIQSAATDLKTGSNGITPETVAYWSQFL